MTWSNNPNAPKNISILFYPWEKAHFIGSLIGAVLYGIIIVFFFWCIEALLNPANRMKRSVKWGLVAHTVAMFSFTSIGFAIERSMGSVSYIDKRGFRGNRKASPGPYGYWVFLENFSAAAVPHSAAFPLSQWLADGLLLYRCWVIYSMNYLIIAFPSLLYVASVGTGIMYIWQNNHRRGYGTTHFEFDVWVVYQSIALSLGVILTFMIIIRLALHAKNVRSAIGASAGGAGLYTAVVTMLVESYALYVINYLLFIGLATTGSPYQYIASPLLSSAQIIAPFLIILRVANRRALTGEAINSGSRVIGSIHFEEQAQVSTGSDVNTHEERSNTNSGKTKEEHSVEVEEAIEEVPSS